MDVMRQTCGCLPICRYTALEGGVRQRDQEQEGLLWGTDIKISKDNQGGYG